MDDELKALIEKRMEAAGRISPQASRLLCDTLTVVEAVRNWYAQEGGRVEAGALSEALEYLEVE